MSAAHVRQWARGQLLPATQKVVLIELAELADKEGRGEFDPGEVRRSVGQSESEFIRSMTALGGRGLVNGPRFQIGKGFTSTAFRLQIAGLRSVSDRAAA